MENQFAGMSDLPFSYTDFEETRSRLISDVKNILSEEDRDFLISFEEGKPKWYINTYAEFSEFPSIKWKLLNIEKLRHSNPKKLQREVDRLREVLE